MIHDNEVKLTVFGFLYKITGWKLIGNATASTAAGYTFTRVLKSAFADVTEKDLLILALITSGMFLLYLVIYASDFVTGLQASRKEALDKGITKGWILSNKLYSSLWKLVGILLVLFILAVFSLFCLMVGLSFFYNVLLYCIAGFMFMVYMFDMHSIGENIKRKTGVKPKFFDFLESSVDIIQTGLKNKLKSLF